MKKIVISGSSKLQDEAIYWLNHFESKGYEILDYNRPIEGEKFIELYPKVYEDFYNNIVKSDILFIMNEDKDGIEGYIGSSSFAELNFGITQKIIYQKDIELVLLKMPSEEVSSYNEINLWLKLGWIKLYNEED